jgi:hypothetical protein
MLTGFGRLFLLDTLFRKTPPSAINLGAIVPAGEMVNYGPGDSPDLIAA